MAKEIATTEPRAAVYGRVSMAKQKASGAGEFAQDDDCTDFAAREGYEILGTFLEDEAVSGSKSIEHRPALLEAIGMMRKGDVLLVAKRDRLGRDPMVIAAIEHEVKRKKCRIVSAAGEGTADDSPESIFMRRIMDAAAEFERLRLIVRCKAAAAAKRRRGLKCGQSPYGWDPDPNGPISELTGKPCGFAENAKEQRIIAIIRQMREGGVALRAIAADLNEMGIPTKRGLGSSEGRQWTGKWTHSAVDSVLKFSPLWSEHAQAKAQRALESAAVSVGDGESGD